MLLVGDVKEIGQARFGVKLVIKHLPDMPFMLGDDVHRRLKSRFAAELALADTVAGARLIAVATFGRGVAGVPSIEEMLSSRSPSSGSRSRTPSRRNSSALSSRRGPLRQDPSL